jgi:hypothetical protein
MICQLSKRRKASRKLFELLHVQRHTAQHNVRQPLGNVHMLWKTHQTSYVRCVELKGIDEGHHSH